MGRIDFKQNDDSGSGTGVSGSIYSISQSTTGQGSGLAFNTGVPSSATERMRIDSSGTISIGPSTTSSEIYFNYNNTNNKGGLKIDYSTGELRLTAGESGNTYRQAFYLNGSERMRIDSSGNVGIGNTTPSSFHNDANNLVVGTGSSMEGITIYSGTDSHGGLYFADGTSGSEAYRGFITYNQPSDYFALGTAGSEKMRITSGGNVGIGTTSPNADLEVYTDIGGGNTLRLNTNFGGGNTVDINPYITGINNGGMEIKLAGSQKVVINPSGNVGIGTTSPAQKLDVVGIIKSSGISNSLMFSDRNTASNSWEWYSSGNNAGLYKNHNGPGTVMTIDSSDNVGIGTTSPSAKLDVVMPDSGGATRQDIFRLLQSGQNTLSCYMYGGTTDLVQLHVSGAEQHLSLTTGGTATATTATGIHLRSGGNVGIATLDPQAKLQVNQSGASLIGAIIKATDSGYYNQVLQISCARGATSGYNLIQALNNTSTECFKVAGTGNVSNTNNSYGAISDARLKENIVDATPKLNDLMKVKIRNFNLIGDDNKQIGVIAQEIEKVFPSLVENTKEKNSEEITKSVKYSVFVPMLIKAMQELKAEIETLKSQING
jgi:hypothetical protein